MDYLRKTSLSDLERMIDNERDPTIKNKLLVVWHKKQGKTEEQVESILRVPRSTVGHIVRTFKLLGIRGFVRKTDGVGGQNKYLTKQQEKQLQEKLEKQPMTTKEAWIYIKDNFGKEYHPNSIPRLLRRLGQSLITPRPRHYQANPKSESAFRGHIKKVKFVEI